ncbi:SIS domain-containing protein [Gemmatimonadota bacterium]
MDQTMKDSEQASDEFSSRRIADDYLAEFQNLLDRIDLDGIARVVERLRGARDRGATIFVVGNGGSAATAAHLVNDLGKATKGSGRPPIRVMCLSDNVSWLTALANDEGYERVFTGQLENFARAGDVLILISASGSSPNLVDVAGYAQEHEVETIGILGFDGGKLKRTVDEVLWLESDVGSYGPVESGHTVICDILTTCLIRDFAVDGGGDSLR